MSDEEDNTSPPEIFKQEYEDRSKLQGQLDALLDKKLEGEAEELERQYEVALHLAALGHNFVHTEELSPGEAALQRARTLFEVLLAGRVADKDPGTEQGREPEGGPPDLKEVLDGCTLRFRDLNLFIRAYNNLGALWFNRQNPEKAHLYLKNAEYLHDKWAEWYTGAKGDQAQIKQREESDKIDAKAMAKETEDDFTLSVFYLAQTSTSLGDIPAASKYCHKTLELQLDTKKDFNPNEWAANCCQLETFHTTEGDIGASQYCLTAARHVLDNQKEADKDPRAVATVALAWGHFHAKMLSLARTQRQHSPESSPKLGLSRVDPNDSTKVAVPHTFQNLPDVPPPPTSITLAVTFEEAREVFKSALREFNTALGFFQLDGYVTEHISVKCDISSLYSSLCFFENDLERLVAMHKVRAGLFSNIVNQINISAYIQFVRQSLYEVGEIWNDMTDTRFKQRKLLEEANEGKPVPDKRLREGCDKTVEHFEKFLNTFKKDVISDKGLCVSSDPATGWWPEDDDLHESWFKSWINAVIQICRQLVRRPVDDYTELLKNHQKAMERYKLILEFAERYNVAEKVADCAEEVSTVKEMVELLPGKMAQIEQKRATAPAGYGTGRRVK